MRVSGSVAMAHSSMIICLTLRCSREAADAAEHVHRMTSWPASSYARAADNCCLYLVVDAEDMRESSPGSSCRNQAETVLSQIIMALSPSPG